MPNNASKASAEKPLLGAQLCCTSIPPEMRSQLAQWAEEMGAEHTLDLTSDVTHLLVGDTDSKKYQYVAKEREDVKVLLPQFVQALRELWMNDQPIDLHQLEAQYRCPTLFGLKLSVTGFEDLAFRDELAKNIVKNGGQYSGDLTKDCTHLIAFTPAGKKFEYASVWRLKIVSIKWYKDTLDRGMQLDESKYHPAMLPQDQGIGAWNRLTPGISRLGKRQNVEQQPQEQSRKLRRTASARFGSQQNDMWNDIVGPRSSGTAGKETSALRPSKSMPQIYPASQSEAGEVATVNAADVVPIHPVQAQGPSPGHNSGIFAGKHFAVKGFDTRRRDVVNGTLVGHGATLHNKLSDIGQTAASGDEVCYLIVPFEIEAHQLSVLEQKCPKVTIVTELWLEWCLTSKHFVSPDHYPLGLPVTEIRPPGATRLAVNATGFPQRQTLHISKLIKKIGAVYQDTFTPDTTLLICCLANPNPQKIAHANAWKMPVVSEKWLWQLIKSSRIPPFEPYSLVSGVSDVNSKDQQHRLRSAQVLGRSNELRPPGDTGHLRPMTRQETGQDISANAPPNDAEDLTHDRDSSLPLQEVSANIPPRRPSPHKKKLFQTFDSIIQPRADRVTAEFDHHDNDACTIPNHNEPPEQNSVSAQLEPKSHSDLLNDFFEFKAAAAAKAAAEANKPSSSRPKMLIGRALSNLSNNSATSNSGTRETPKPLSRASSINSVNTDGLGVPLSAMSRIPSELKGRQAAQQARTAAATGNAADTNPSANDRPQALFLPDTKGITPLDFHAALTTLSTSQPALPPEPSPEPQMSYADSEQATRLKAKLAEMRRRRVRLGQQEGDPEAELTREESEERRQRAWQERNEAKDIIRDDEAVVGRGRRTRGREKALNALLSHGDELGRVGGEIEF